MIGCYCSIEFFLMEVGYIKFSLDWYFGFWKMKWRYFIVEIFDEVVELVRCFLRNGYNIFQFINDVDMLVFFYNWVSFFEVFFKKLLFIFKFYYFRMFEESLGVVFVKVYCSFVEKFINILKKGQ